ncbi:alpha/beta hydrolase [Glycomyces dulcitolivorans]|uniref:alpha/beta hydrolase n=1 Tax=Glycomyces dulcitolivorans TaxID=2200759 RepID=UPI0018E51AB6|nr:alpha/beta hydrolase [Glycomyces dulcitolivorans]
MSIPWGYLVSLAVLTLPALPVPRLPEKLGTALFLVCLAVNELPFLAIALFLANTGLALAQGDLASPVAVAAAVVGGACIALTTRRSLRAAPVLQAATGEARTRLPWADILLRPFPIRPWQVERTANLAYGPNGKRNLLDVYRHRSHPTGAPVLIHFHGGHYDMGRKNSQSLPLLHRLAAHGWVCVSANYRLRPEGSFDEHLTDAKRVIAWVREHAGDFGADPDRIVLSGSSAGAHLSALAALTHDHPGLQPGFEDADTSVSAVVGLGGWYGTYFTGEPRTAPLTHARADAPPFLIVHGDHDSVVHVSHARRFAADLRAASGATVHYAELPGAHHGFDLFRSPRFEAVVSAVEAFASRAVSIRS